MSEFFRFPAPGEWTLCPKCMRDWTRAEGSPVRHYSPDGLCFLCLSIKGWPDITHDELTEIKNGPGVKETIYL